MNGNAPKSSNTGFHIDRVIKLQPNFSKVSVEFLAISMTINTSVPAMARANSRVVCLNSQSAGVSEPRRAEKKRGLPDAGGVLFVTVWFIVVLMYGRLSVAAPLRPK